MSEVTKRQTPNSKIAIERMEQPKPPTATTSTKKSLQFDNLQEFPQTGDISDTYVYMSPMEQSIKALQTETQEELNSALEHLENLRERYPTVPAHPNRQQCSQCHLRGDHNRRNGQVKCLYVYTNVHICIHCQLLLPFICIMPFYF